MTKLILCSLKSIKPQADIYIQGTRTQPKPGWVHVPDLSPSKELFKYYLNMRDMGMWPQSWYQYAVRFEQEMQEPKMKSMLDLMETRLNQGKTIAFACFCKNVQYCHRLLIGIYFNTKDYQVVGMGNQLGAGPPSPRCLQTHY